MHACPRVIQVRKKDTGTVYAMKVLSKDDVLKTNQVQATKTERRVLEVRLYHTATANFLVLAKQHAADLGDDVFLVLSMRLQVINHPFIVKLHYAFQVGECAYIYIYIYVYIYVYMYIYRILCNQTHTSMPQHAGTL
jgi:hypothetical protein